MVAKRKKKSNVDIRLYVLRNIRKTFKYFFKNIFYILFVNVFLFFFLTYFLKVRYSIFILRFFSTPASYEIAYYSVFLTLFTTLKVILYGNTVYVMKARGTNDIKDLFSTVIKRYFPTLGTLIIYVLVVVLLGLLLVIPGIVFFFYFYFAVFLCGVGDVNNKENNKVKLLNGGKALGRSFRLVRGNLVRFMISTTIAYALVYFIDKGAVHLLINSGLTFNNFTLNAMRLCIYDLLIIYGALMFMKLQGIENDVIEEEFRNNQEEQALMHQATLDNLNKAKKK